MSRLMRRFERKILERVSLCLSLPMICSDVYSQDEDLCIETGMAIQSSHAMPNLSRFISKEDS